MSSDRELYEAWRAGDDHAGNALFDRHFDAVYRFFRGKVTDGAEDLVQQTFLSCVTAASPFRGDSSFRSYLLTIAKSRLYDHLRLRQRRPDLDFTEMTLEALGPSLGAHLAQREQERLVHLALAKLPLEMHIAVELYYFDELSAAEVAAVLEVPEGTVRSRLRRALDSLREALAHLGAPPELFDSSFVRARAD